MERCVVNNIKEQLSGPTSARQHESQSGKSCITNLLESLDTIGSLLDRGGQIDSVYLNMSKAFDKVRHDLLLYKLQEAAFGRNLLRWLSSYPIGRRQQVTVLGAFSRDLPVTSGVPQGSILGPASFLIYVNSLPGLSVSSDLTWNNQVYEQAVRARKLLGYIQRNAKFTINTCTSVRRTLYVGLVRPHIGYATQVWASQSIELISKLESIQRRATKFILRLPFPTSIDYRTRLQSLKLLPITY